jgi:hypothetical protein
VQAVAAASTRLGLITKAEQGEIFDAETRQTKAEKRSVHKAHALTGCKQPARVCIPQHSSI